MARRVKDRPYTGDTVVTAYCMKCKKKKIKMQDPVITRMANGRDAVKGHCPRCGTGLFRIGVPE